MKDYITKLTAVFLFNSLFLSVIGQNIDSIKVIAGNCIIFNHDTISLEKTKIKQTCEILGIPDQTNCSKFRGVNWSGFDSETGEDVHGSYCLKEINYKSIIFEYTAENIKQPFVLSLIRLKADSTCKIYTDNGLKIGDINPNILNILSLTHVSDYKSDDGLAYGFYYHGIHFRLEKNTNDDLLITEITITKQKK